MNKMKKEEFREIPVSEAKRLETSIVRALRQRVIVWWISMHGLSNT